MTRNEPDLNLLALPPHVRERWSMAVERAVRKTQAAVPNPAVGPLVKAAQNGSTAAQRMVWLHEQCPRGRSLCRTLQPAAAAVRTAATSR